jgi:hypothetical protein
MAGRGWALFGGFHGPVLAAMLLEEMERAELHDPDTMPPGTQG